MTNESPAFAAREQRGEGAKVESCVRGDWGGRLKAVEVPAGNLIFEVGNQKTTNDSRPHTGRPTLCRRSYRSKSLPGNRVCSSFRTSAVGLRGHELRWLGEIATDVSCFHGTIAIDNAQGLYSGASAMPVLNRGRGAAHGVEPFARLAAWERCRRRALAVPAIQQA